jgi:hypothetical protein
MCQTKRQVTKSTDGDWLQVVRNRRPRVLLRKQGMLVLDACQGHLTLDATSMIHENEY